MRYVTLLFAVVCSLAAVVLASRHLAAFDSDALYALSVYRDAFLRPYPLLGWALTPTPYFFPDLAGMFALFAVTPDPGFAYVAYEVVFLLGVMALVSLIAKEVDVSRRLRADALVGIGLALCALLQVKESHLLAWDFLFPTFHGGTMLSGLAIVLLTLRALRTGRWRALAAITTLASLSDIVILPQFLLPLGISLFVLARGQHLDTKRVFLTIKVLALSFVAGLLTCQALRWLGIFDIGAGVNHLLARSPARSVKQFIADLPLLWHHYGVVLALGTLWLATTLVQLRRHRRTASGSWFLLSLVIGLSVIGSVAAAVLNGRYNDEMLIRQFVPTFLLPCLFLTSAFWTKPETTERRRWAGGALALITLAMGYAAFTEARSLTSASLQLPYPATVRCLDDLKDEGELTQGFGDYWSAKFARELSQRGVIVNQIGAAALTPEAWISNPKWHPIDSAKPYDFIIAARLDKDRIRSHYGDWLKERDCAGWSILVYDRVKGIH